MNKKVSDLEFRSTPPPPHPTATNHMRIFPEEMTQLGTQSHLQRPGSDGGKCALMGNSVLSSD